MPLLSILTVALMVFALVDIIRIDGGRVKFLPKMAWLFIVILLPLIGSLLWFSLGRDYGEAGISIPRMRRAERPAARTDAVPLARPVDARTTEQQIADLDREIEEWRLREEIAKRKREQGPSTGSGTQI